MERINKPTKKEWKRCLQQTPFACVPIENLERKAADIGTYSKDWRSRLNLARQEIDKICRDCHAFKLLHSRNIGSKSVEDLPCQKLRREIQEERLDGVWYVKIRG